MGYVFYGNQDADVGAVTEDFPGIRTPKDLYDALAGVWCKETCPPRMRDKWTLENRTLGQCSITAFLVQDIFGGRVYGMLRPDGNYHCYNEVDGHVFDLTSEQFGDEKLSYEGNPEQFREVHFKKEEKRLRYERLRALLRERCRREASGRARIAGTVRHSSVDGPGVRYVVFFQGCPHHCPGCQNPDTWDPEGGEEASLEDLVEELRATRYLDGVTLSGGDPFLQPEAAMAVADAAREMGLTVWAYTGWTFEALLGGAAGERARELLRHLDVVVDGPFQKELLSKECIYRGSGNQRLVDVPASLVAGRAVEAEI